MKPINAPFFELGPKNYLTRQVLLDLCRVALQASETWNVDVIVTPSIVDLEHVKTRFSGLHVFAQHMDAEEPGGDVGRITAEALSNIGADGVMLNHARRPMTMSRLRRTIGRARAVGLTSLVCVDGALDATQVAEMSPDIILAEPARLIGTSQSGLERSWIPKMDNAIHRIDDRIMVMHGGGISSVDDVRAVMKAGSSGTGATSAIIGATSPPEVLANLIRATREGWDEVTTGAPISSRRR